MKRTLYLWIMASLLLASCGSLEVSLEENGASIPIQATTGAAKGAPEAQFTATVTAPPLSLDMLANAEYHSVALESDQANFRLVNGIHYLPHLPEESDSAYYVSLTNRMAYGDLDGDGIQDAVVILHSQTGGTAHYHNELAAVLNQNGEPRNVATVSLGDRVVVNSILINNGEITVNMLADPMLTGSPQEMTMIYRLSGTELFNMTPIPVASQAAAVTPEAPPAAPACANNWFFVFNSQHAALGSFCPGPVLTVAAVGQDFEGGRAYRYAADPAYTADQRGTVYVIYNDGEWLTFPDGWDAGQPSSDASLIPPEGRYQPVESIGKAWRENPEVRSRLGWALEPQSAFQGHVQVYSQQEGVPGGDSHFIFIDHGKWGLVLLLDAVDMGPNTWEVAGSY
jgi:hypothetical protein